MKSRHFNVVAPDGVNFELHEDGRIIVELPFTPQQLGAKPLAHKPSNFTFDTFRHGDDDLIELSRDGLAITLSVPADSVLGRVLLDLDLIGDPEPVLQ